MQCNNCHAEIIGDRKLCQVCGTKVVVPKIPCPTCGMLHPEHTAICSHCGYLFNFKKRPAAYRSKYMLDFRESHTLSAQINAHFLKAFKDRIAAEHQIEQWAVYRQCYDDSVVQKSFAVRRTQLAEECYTLHSAGAANLNQQIDALLEDHFEATLDHFLILYCRHLNETELPEAILQYGQVSLATVDIQQMILDYLDLSQEPENFYIDFIKMPISKLKNASSSFLFPQRDEKIVIICDQTILGSCKEGFALTELGLYWKAHFNPGQQLYFSEIKGVFREKEWITINNHFFNVSPSVNLKMLKLLKRLQRLYRYTIL
ncbi:MAG: zinc ribbon domain-containing protein [Saprospiraceae bacterium]